MIRNFALMAVMMCIAALPLAAEVISTHAVTRDNTGKPLPRFNKGHLVFYDRDSGAVSSYAPDGTLIFDVTLKLPETSRINIRDVSSNGDGTVAVAGSALSTDGSQAASVIFLISPTGQVERAIRTTPFGASRLVFSPTGTVWAAGKEYDQTFRETPKHNILREYDTSGRLVRTVLSTESFGSAKHPIASAFLVGNGDRLGLYSDAVNQYVELDWLGNTLERHHTPPIPRPTVVLSATVTQTGDLYVGGALKSENSKSVVLRFDRTRNRFDPFPLPETAGALRPVLLVGAANNDLVVYGKPPGIIKLSTK